MKWRQAACSGPSLDYPPEGTVGRGRNGTAPGPTCLDRAKMPRQGLTECTSGEPARPAGTPGQPPVGGFKNKRREQGPAFVRSYRLTCRLTRPGIILGAAALAMTMADAQQSRSRAQGKLDARYAVTLGGLPIGQGAWVIEIGED